MLNESDKGLEFELFFNIIHNVYGKIAKTIIERSVLRNKFVIRHEHATLQILNGLKVGKAIQYTDL